MIVLLPIGIFLTVLVLTVEPRLRSVLRAGMQKSLHAFGYLVSVRKRDRQPFSRSVPTGRNWVSHQPALGNRPPRRHFAATPAELLERRLLQQRPSEEAFLHWAYRGRRLHLHGDLLPPNDGHRHSTTSGGWCIGRH